MMPDGADHRVCCGSVFVVWKGEFSLEAIIPASIFVCVVIACSQLVRFHFSFPLATFNAPEIPSPEELSLDMASSKLNQASLNVGHVTLIIQPGYSSPLVH